MWLLNTFLFSSSLFVHVKDLRGIICRGSFKGMVHGRWDKSRALARFLLLIADFFPKGFRAKVVGDENETLLYEKQRSGQLQHDRRITT